MPPLPPTGPLSFNDINVELGLPGDNSNSSIDSPTYRTLAQIPSGTIALSDFYGKSPAPPPPPPPPPPPSSYPLDYAIIGGGGGGGAGISGGGGGGGSGAIGTNLASPFGDGTVNPAAPCMEWSPGASWTITVTGGGVAGRQPVYQQGGSGGTGCIVGGPFLIYGCAGGGGATASSPTGTPATLSGRSAGTGGGGATVNPPQFFTLCGFGGTGIGTPGNGCQGYNGADAGIGSPAGVNGGGGGGGIISAGQNNAPGAYQGAGGQGVDWRGFWPMGGGGGGRMRCACNNYISPGGYGGGGASAPSNPNATQGVNGTCNTGGGGGGAGGAGACCGGSGGRGVGIIGYPGPQKATGGEIYDQGSYTYHVFRSTGTFTIN